MVEAVGSLLIHCRRRQQSVSRRCRSLDLGANNGFVTLRMLQLGSDVTAVEPQADLSRAMSDSAVLNCWDRQLRVLNARACATSERSYSQCIAPSSSWADMNFGWRIGRYFSTGKAQLHLEKHALHGDRWPEQMGLPATVSGVNLTELLLDSAKGISAEARRTIGNALELDLIKMDADGPEGGWMQEIELLLSKQALRVRHMIVEGNHLKPRTLMRMQQVHGYTFYRLDEHDGRRFITREGWDAFSPPGTIARLDRLAFEHRAIDRAVQKDSVAKLERLVGSRAYLPMGDNVSRDALEDELFGVRAMRHVFRVKPNISFQGWVTLLNPLMRPGWPPQWLLTLDGDLTEPSLPPHFKTPQSMTPEEREAQARGWWARPVPKRDTTARHGPIMEKIAHTNECRPPLRVGSCKCAWMTAGRCSAKRNDQTPCWTECCSAWKQLKC